MVHEVVGKDGKRRLIRTRKATYLARKQLINGPGPAKERKRANVYKD